MDNITMWAAIVGTINPAFISIINRPGWDKRVRVGVMLAFCLLTGTLTAHFAGELNGKDITASVLTVLVSTIASYNGIFKPSGGAAKIEEKTSPSTEFNAGDVAG